MAQRILAFAAVLAAPAQARATSSGAPGTVRQSVGPSSEPMTDILDIKGPVPLPGEVPWLWILLGLAAAALLALGVWLLLRYLRRPKAGPPAPTPEELALADLADLERDLEAGAADARTFYFQLSGLARGYLEERTGARLLEMTTEEVLAVLPELGLPAELSGGVRELLRGSDPVRYAGAGAAQERMRRDLEFARRLVAGMAPDPEPAEAEVVCGEDGWC
ncbi:MAG: hypothetical protein ACOCVM_00610 [Desulfovibrionaceae bacterium]